MVDDDIFLGLPLDQYRTFGSTQAFVYKPNGFDVTRRRIMFPYPMSPIESLRSSSEPSLRLLRRVEGSHRRFNKTMDGWTGIVSLLDLVRTWDVFVSLPTFSQLPADKSGFLLDPIDRTTYRPTTPS